MVDVVVVGLRGGFCFNRDALPAGGAHAEGVQKRFHLGHRFVGDGEIGRLDRVTVGRADDQSAVADLALGFAPAGIGDAIGGERGAVNVFEQLGGGEQGDQADPLGSGFVV